MPQPASAGSIGALEDQMTMGGAYLSSPTRASASLRVATIPAGRGGIMPDPGPLWPCVLGSYSDGPTSMNSPSNDRKALNPSTRIARPRRSQPRMVFPLLSASLVAAFLFSCASSRGVVAPVTATVFLRSGFFGVRESGCPSRLTHNRLNPLRPAAATWRTRAGHSRSRPKRGDYG